MPTELQRIDEPNLFASAEPSRPIGLADLADLAGRPDSTAAPSVRALPHLPGLDGMRGLAVVAVLLFHSGFTWAQGGYLGVSSFFTLSGFLITSLLVAEHRTTGHINLRTFWARRFRRLMPAALAAMTLVIAFGIFAADAVQKRNLAGDIAASVAYVANWRFLFSNQSYADVFGAPSPVLHFWSLAIEEQFYLLFPLLIWAIVRLTRSTTRSRGRVVLTITLATLTFASLATALFAGFSQDAIYFGTETRASELLVGALLAIALSRPGVVGHLTRPRIRAFITGAGIVAFVLVVALWALTPQSSSWLYHGGFTVYALASALIILAVIVPGPLRWGLSRRPLCALGLISYGMYLYHWPIFLWVSEDRFDWPTPVLFVLRIGLTLGVALVSYRFLELPIRRGHPLLNIRPLRLAPIAIAALVISSLVLTRNAPQPTVDFTGDAARFQQALNAAPPPSAIDVNALVPPRPRMAMFGDSTALLTGFGLNDWAAETQQADVVNGFTETGCGIGRGGERRSGNESGPIPEKCNHWERSWGLRVHEQQPNIAVVQIGPWEVADRLLEGDTVWRKPGDPVYDAYLLKEMGLAIDTLAAEGAEVVWLTSPPVGAGTGKDAAFIRGQAAEPARMKRLNEIIETLPQVRPGKVKVVDLGGWMISSGDDERLRADGVHVGDKSTPNNEGLEVAERFLAPAVIDAYKQAWKERRETNDPSVPNAVTTTTTAYHGPPRTVLVLGDAAAQPIANGLRTFGASAGTLNVVTSIDPDCGILQTQIRANKSKFEPTPAKCKNTTDGWLKTAAQLKPDIVVVVPSVWDLTEVQLPGNPSFVTFNDKPFEDALWAQMTRLTTALQDNGAAVSWVTYPRIDWGKTDAVKGPRYGGPNEPLYQASAPQRMDRFNEILAELAYEYQSGPDKSRMKRTKTLDLALFVAKMPGGWPGVLADGLTIADSQAGTVGAWLGPELLTFYADSLRP